MIYTPDVWSIVRFKPKGKPAFYKVLGGWHGSYLYGSSWKLNSGVESIDKVNGFYIVSGYSGSVYKCHEESEGMNHLLLAILLQLKESLKGTHTVKVIPIADYKRKKK